MSGNDNTDPATALGEYFYMRGARASREGCVKVAASLLKTMSGMDVPTLAERLYTTGMSSRGGSRSMAADILNRLGTPGARVDTLP